MPTKYSNADLAQNKPSGGAYTDADLASPATPPADQAEPSMGQQALAGIKNFGIGALKGAGSTANNIGHLLYPDVVARHLTGAPSAEQQESYFKPTTTGQSIGKGVEQAGEFLVPGAAEEEGAAGLGKLIPKAGKFVPKLLASAAGSGLVNKAQGGDFSTGAAAGAAGAGIGAGIKAAAPKLAESALGIKPVQRAFGKTPGQAALDLTSGVRPETVAASGRESMSNLMGDLENHVNQASVRPAPQIRGFLQPPREEIPLHNSPGVEGRLSEPVRLTEPNRPTRPLLPEPSLQTPMTSHAGFPEQLGSGETNIRPRTGPSQHPGMGAAQYIGEIPGERGGPGQSQGVMLRRPPMSASVPPTIEANPNASLGPARGVLSQAQEKAAREEAGTLHGQLGEMSDFLHRGRVSGEPIPEQVTPRRLLDLKRGFSDEHLGWNPNTHDTAVNAGRKAYGAMDQELDRLVPSAKDTNQKVSSLIEILRNADRESRGASTGQKILGRFGAHTGALAGAGFGGTVGYHEGGVPGAIAGAATGATIPELIASPEGQMAAARLLNKAGTLKPATGLLLQGTRGNQ